MSTLFKPRARFFRMNRELPVLVHEPLVDESHDVVSDHHASVVDPRREGTVRGIGIIERGEDVTARVG
jgi:hypothetical protein